jgi:hypothetical protein
MRGGTTMYLGVIASAVILILAAITLCRFAYRCGRWVERCKNAKLIKTSSEKK